MTLKSFILGKKNIEVDLNTQFNIGRGKSILRRRESNITMVKPEKHELETRFVQKLNHNTLVLVKFYQFWNIYVAGMS